MSIARFCADFVRILVTLFRPYSDYVLDFFYGLVIGANRKLPPIEDKLLLMTATELAEKIRKRQVSCETLMRAYVERCKAIHPAINAATDQRYDDALRDAQEVDLFLASQSKSEEEIARDTPLLGLPFSCKESIGVKGMLQTSGLVSAKDHTCEQDGASPAMYRRAGAIPVTVTDVPELCMWWEASNHNFGFTRNPYDNTRTTGGSSGGEGSIIASAGALFGIGNDIAGSIRIPSSFCGIYGHKPSKGIVNNFGTFPFCQMPLDIEDRTTDFVSTGPMCRYVQDLPMLLKILSDNDTRLTLDEKVDFRKVKVYYIESFPGFLNKAVPDVKASIRKAVKHFEETYDIQATPISFPELEYSFPIWESKLLEYDSPPFEFYLAGGKGHSVCLWWELLKSVFRCSDHTLPALYFGLVDRRTKDEFYYFCLVQYQSLEAKFQDILQEDAVILVPTHPEPPPHYLMTIPMYPNIAYTCIFNILGLPSTQIPAGSSRGAPLGIQAVSGRFKDHIGIATAFELDKVFNGWISPCPVTA